MLPQTSSDGQGQLRGEHSQTLLLLKGHPATGKSTLAKALARRLAWPLIDKDAIKDHTYALPQGNTLAYEIMWHVVRLQLEVGLSAVVDSPLSYPIAYATGKSLAAEFGARLLVVETSLHEAQWQDRLEKRLLQPETHRVAGWANMQKLLEEYNSSWRYAIAPEHHLIVDTSQPTDVTVQAIVDHISR
jgi:predicted kinase